MKFLTISSVKDTFSTLPLAERDKLLLAATEYIIELKKKMGDKFDFYGMAGWGRLVSIGEYSSVEEYAQSLQSPIAQAGFINYESYPLIAYDEKTLKAAMESLKAV